MLDTVLKERRFRNKIKFFLIICILVLTLGCNNKQTNQSPISQTIRCEVEQDFLHLLDSPETQIIESQPNYILPTFQKVNDEWRWGIFQHSSSKIIFNHIFVGEDAYLTFSIALRPECWNMNGDGVLFRITAINNGKKKEVYSKYIDPKNNKEDRKWIDERVQLNKNLSGQEAQFVFETLPGKSSTSNDRNADWAVWGSPKLISKGREAQHRNTNKTNIVLITVDTLRSDYLGCYGNEWIHTEHIDQLASNGILFENSYSAAYTTNPSHASILTSLRPFEHGVIGNDYNFASGIPRLPQIMKELNYKTGAVVSVYHFDNRYSGFDKWFDHWDQINNRWLEKNARSFYLLTKGASTATSGAIEWLENVHDDPFFLWLHYYDPHAPYEAADQYHKMYYDGDPTSTEHHSMENVKFNKGWSEEGMAWLKPYTDLEYFKKEYAAEISYTDSQIGRLLEALKRIKILDNTLIVFTADHGESFGEHGLYFDHSTQFKTDTKVPLIFYYPEKLPQGKRIKSMVTGIDIAPTILDVLGETGHYLAKSTFHGKSLKPLWENADLPGKRIISSDGLFYKDIAAWDNRYKVIWELRRTESHEDFQQYPDRVWIFDLEKDPNELNPVGCFYWTSEANITDEDKAKYDPLPSDSADVRLKKSIERVEHLAGKKRIPTEEELKQWLQKNQDHVFVKKEYLNNSLFFKRVIAIMNVLKKRVSPPSLREILKDIPDVSAMEEVEIESMQIDDEAFVSHLQSLGYTGTR